MVDWMIDRAKKFDLHTPLAPFLELVPPSVRKRCRLLNRRLHYFW